MQTFGECSTGCRLIPEADSGDSGIKLFCRNRWYDCIGKQHRMSAVAKIPFKVTLRVLETHRMTSRFMAWVLDIRL